MEALINPNQINSADKKSIIGLAQQFNQDVILSNQYDRLKILAQVRKMQLFLTEVDSYLKESTIVDVEQYGKMAVENGVEFTIAEAGVKYDYSANEKWVEITKQIDELAEKRKKMEAFIKTLESYRLEVDPETGEQIEWYPASKSSTTIVKCSIK